MKRLLVFFALIYAIDLLASGRRLSDPFELNGKWLFSSERVHGSRVPMDEPTISSPIRSLSLLISKRCWHGGKHAEWLRLSIDTNQFAGQGDEQSFTVSLPIEMSFGQVQMDLMSDPCVRGVGRSGTMSLLSTQDPLVVNQNHINALGGVSEVQYFQYGPGEIRSSVTLAVIDTGLELSHPEFLGRLWVNEKEASGQVGVDDDQNGYIDDINGYNFVDRVGDPSHKNSNDHGTHVTGLAGAAAGNGIGGMGIAGKNIKLMALNVLGSHWNDVSLTDVEAAIRYAADNGADIINISIGAAGDYPTFAAAIVYALKKGVVIVVAAGNSIADIDQVFQTPGSYAQNYPGMISVGAVDTSGGAICGFSNFGTRGVKIAAPGCDATAFKGGLLSSSRNSGFGFRKGTSMSAPLISGAAALIIGNLKDKSMRPTPEMVENYLLSTAKKDPKLQGKFQDGRVFDLTELSKKLQLVAP
jgi:hypothetical protein